MQGKGTSDIWPQCRKKSSKIPIEVSGRVSGGTQIAEKVLMWAHRSHQTKENPINAIALRILVSIINVFVCVCVFFVLERKSRIAN